VRQVVNEDYKARKAWLTALLKGRIRLMPSDEYDKDSSKLEKVIGGNFTLQKPSQLVILYFNHVERGIVNWGTFACVGKGCLRQAIRGGPRAENFNASASSLPERGSAAGLQLASISSKSRPKGKQLRD